MNKADKEVRRSEWRELIEAQERSGLSRVEFCKQNNLVLSQFVYYRSQIRRPAEVQKENAFIPIQIAPVDSRHLSEIRILLPNGLECILPCCIESKYVKALVGALLSC